MRLLTKRSSGPPDIVAALCSQWIARSPGRKGVRARPLSKFVRQQRTVQTKTVIAFIVGSVLGFAVSHTLDVLSGSRFPIHAPARPSGVPAIAYWSGGPDGGNWFNCTRPSFEIWECSVYTDTTGTLVAQGKYKLAADPQRREFQPNLLVSDREIQLSGARLVKIER